jgi:serine/threonine protein kinase
MRKPSAGDHFQERYQILSELGEGGMGAVYRARQLDVGREVAIKVPHIDGIAGADTLARFMREFKLLCQLSHPHIMTIYALGLDDDVPYAVCEYLDGESLRARIDRGPLPWQQAVQITLQICDAMQYAHDGGILHRDLKPENVLLINAPEPDYVKLIDFGLSRIYLELRESQKLTRTGMLVGSPNYMAPEQAKGQTDPRSDIYALACLLYEALSGAALFEADSPLQVIARQCQEDPSRRLKALAKKVPQSLLQILARALQKDPEKRYQSMKELAAHLESLLDHKDEAQKELRKQTPVFSLAGIACLAAVLLLLFLAKQHGQIFDHKQSGQKFEQRQAGRTAAVKTSQLAPGRREMAPGTLASEGDISQNDAESLIPMLTDNLKQLQKRGHGSPQLLYETHYSLGKAYQSRQDFMKAADEFKSAADAFSNPHSSDRLNAACAAAFMLIAAGRAGEAAEICKRFVEPYEKSAGQEADPHLIRAKGCYALMLEGAGDYKKSCAVARSGLQACDRCFGGRDTQDAVDLSWVLLRSAKALGDTKQAEQELAKTRRALLAAAKDDAASEETGPSLFRFAYNDARQGNNRQSEQMCKMALKFVGSTSSPQADQALKINCDTLLARLKATDKPGGKR